MIREITRRQIDFKTAQGERVVMIEAQRVDSDNAGYDAGHIPGAILMPAGRVRELATQYLPDPGAEIVVYGAGERASEVDEVARQLSVMGYGNLYVYRGGKSEWFGAAGAFRESTHLPPASGTHVRFDGGAAAGMSSGPGMAGAGLSVAWRRKRPRWRELALLLRSVAVVGALYGVARVLGVLPGKRGVASGRAERGALGGLPTRGSRSKGWFVLTQNHVQDPIDDQIDDQTDGDLERNARAFDSASAAE